ncbi:MAG: pathogenesis-related family 1 protein [Leucothrix sp.]
MFRGKIITPNLIKIGLGLNCGLLAIACSGGGTIPQKENPTRASGGSQPDIETVTFTHSQQPDPHEHFIERPISAGQRFARTLDAHNTVRTAHNLPPLTWSAHLANYAQQWANRSANVRNCGMQHRPQQGPFKQQYGENLWWASPRIWSTGLRELQPVTIERVVKDWADEKAFYNYATNSCQAGEQCGHYTQIVWRDTTEVGCAYQQCGDKSQLWVCNYSPAGNYIGERPY